MIKIVLITQLIFVPLLAESQNREAERDSILLLHFDKVGGIDQWQQLNTYYVKRSTLTTSHFLPPHERSFDDYSSGHTNTYFQAPDQRRDELYKDDKGATLTFITNRDKSMLFRHSIGKESILPEIYHKSVPYSQHLYSIGATPHLLSALKKDSLNYEGIVDAYGRQCYMFFSAVRNPARENLNLIIYIDVVTHLVHAVSSTSKELRYALYTDYKNVDGLVIPHTYTSYDDGVLHEEYKILEVKINQPLDDLLFQIW